MDQKANHQWDVLSQCPYFKEAGSNYIRCDGIYENSSITTRIGSKQLAIWHIVTYCCCNYKMCPLYSTITEMRGDDG